MQGEFSFLCQDPSMMPSLPKVIDPHEIVARAKGDIVTKLNEDENTDDDGDLTINCSSNTTSSTTQLGLAYEAIWNKRVSLVNSGCWMLIGTDNNTTP